MYARTQVRACVCSASPSCAMCVLCFTMLCCVCVCVHARMCMTAAKKVEQQAVVREGKFFSMCHLAGCKAFGAWKVPITRHLYPRASVQHMFLMETSPLFREGRGHTWSEHPNADIAVLAPMHPWLCAATLPSVIVNNSKVSCCTAPWHCCTIPLSPCSCWCVPKACTPPLRFHFRLAATSQCLLSPPLKIHGRYLEL